MTIEKKTLRFALVYACLGLSAHGLGDDSATAVLRRFMNTSQQNIDAGSPEGAALLEAASDGSPAFFAELEKELRRLRRVPLLQETLAQRREATRVRLLRRTLFYAECHNPGLIEFAEESLADRQTSDEFLRYMVRSTAYRIYLDPRHHVDGCRMSAFLLRAVEHEDEGVRKAALTGLTGCLSGRDCETEAGWNLEAAIPLLKRFANDTERSLWDRTWYIDVLIALDIDGEKYLKVYRDYIADPEVELHSRIHIARHLVFMGYLNQETLDELEAEQKRMRDELKRSKTTATVITGPENSSRRR